MKYYNVSKKLIFAYAQARAVYHDYYTYMFMYLLCKAIDDAGLELYMSLDLAI